MLKFTANLSMLFTEVPLEQRFKLAKDCGFDAVEIQFPYEMPALQIKEILQAQDLKLVLFNVVADDLLDGGEGLAAVPEKREQFKQAVEQASDYAKVLEPEVINVLPGRCMDESRTPEYLQTFKQNLQHALAAFSPLGIKTVFEAINTHDMPRFIIHDSEQMLSILREINHPDLLMQYDVYHMQRMGEDCAAVIQGNADKIGHIQFADVPGRGQPGTGGIDFKTLFKAIENSTYQQWLGAEYRPVGASTESCGWLSR